MNCTSTDPTLGQNKLLALIADRLNCLTAYENASVQYDVITDGTGLAYAAGTIRSIQITVINEGSGGSTFQGESIRTGQSISINTNGFGRIMTDITIAIAAGTGGEIAVTTVAAAS